MKRPVFSFRPKLENPSHRRAWEILQAVPEGQKNTYLVQAILQAEEKNVLEKMIRQVIHEELKDLSIPAQENEKPRPEEIPAPMLDFLTSLGDT